MLDCATKLQIWGCFNLVLGIVISLAYRKLTGKGKGEGL
jgi:hypothetical protein